MSSVFNTCALAAASTLAILALTGTIACAAPQGDMPPAVDQALARTLLQEMIETDTQHVNGSTGLAHKIEARLKAAGFADQDVTFIAPPGHPERGNVVVRLRGKGRMKPLLYICHLDVVNARKEDWTTDPFKLVEKDGFFFGRGTFDMKGQTAAVMESLLRLMAEGFKPEGDLIVAFTDDEEGGGIADGAEFLALKHKDLIDAALVINTDAGEAVERADGVRYLGIQTSEKIYVTYSVEAKDRGGHSSRPTAENPIFRLSRALARLDAYRFPVNLTDTVKLYFKGRAQLETGQMKADLQAMAEPNPDPAVVARLTAIDETNIMFRTTCVATEISGGHAESALPQKARATIQCRVLPNETTASVRAKLEQVLAEPKLVPTEVVPGDEGPESPPAPKLLKTIDAVARPMFPNVVLLPFMSPGASDGTYTRMVGMPTYGVDALWYDGVTDTRHGQDERVPVKAFYQEVEFTYRLMKTLASGK